jgi:prophage DNA circulation protein
MERNNPSASEDAKKIGPWSRISSDSASGVLQALQEVDRTPVPMDTSAVGSSLVGAGTFLPENRLVTRGSDPLAGSEMTLHSAQVNPMQAILDMLALQHAQTTTTLSTMSARHEAQAQQSVQHTELTVTRATQQAISREMQAELDQINRDKAQLTGVLARVDIPDWYRAEKVAALEALQVRGQALFLRKLAHEQQYHLLNAADEGVGARPSQC